MTETFTQTNRFEASPERVYAAIATSAEHSAFTGAPAEIGGAAGAPFTTHGGAIEGWMLEVAPGDRIVQAWRPADWPAGVFSLVRYDFTADGDGTTVTLTHSSVPEGGSGHLEAGWNERYWAPLAEHLAA